MMGNPEACPGLILAGAEFFLGGAESQPNFLPLLKKICPPVEFDSAPGAEQTTKGGPYASLIAFSSIAEIYYFKF